MYPRWVVQVSQVIEIRLQVAERKRSESLNSLDPFLGSSLELVVRNDFVNHAPFERLLRTDPLGEQQHLPRSAVADHQRQVLGRTNDRQRADLGSRLTKNGVFARNAEITIKLPLVAAADTETT